MNSLKYQLSKNSDATQTPIINPQEKNLFPKTAAETRTPVKQKLSHNTETTKLHW